MTVICPHCGRKGTLQRLPQSAVNPRYAASVIHEDEPRRICRLAYYQLQRLDEPKQLDIDPRWR